jgi:hypothetical protein
LAKACGPFLTPNLPGTAIAVTDPTATPISERANQKDFLMNEDLRPDIPDDEPQAVSSKPPTTIIVNCRP